MGRSVALHARTAVLLFVAIVVLVAPGACAVSAAAARSGPSGARSWVRLSRRDHPHGERPVPAPVAFLVSAAAANAAFVDARRRRRGLPALRRAAQACRLGPALLARGGPTAAPAVAWSRGSGLGTAGAGGHTSGALPPGTPMIGYVTVGHRDDHRAFAAIQEACDEAGWLLAEIVHDRGTARALDRPGLGYALKQVAAGYARGLIVSDLRRLTRSLPELGALLEWFRDADAALVALDLDLDTTTPTGRDVATSLITVGGWERDRIARSTRRGIARVKSEGRAAGRPAVRDRPELVERITRMRDAGLTLQAIADRLNAEGTPTLRGGAMWRPSSVQAALGYRRPRSRRISEQLPSLDHDEEED